MTVERFDPGAFAPALTDERVAELLGAAGRLDEPDFGLDADAVARLAGTARHDDKCDWRRAAESLGDAEIEGLVRLFTRAESLPGWEAGAQSPVIVLAAVLKARDAWPADLTAWIKANTDNRFLPYGSLMDRL